jgi:hypothetical protein
MRSVWYGATLLGALAFVACETGTDTTAPRLVQVEASAAKSAGGARQQRVTGSATITLPMDGSPLEHYSVSALRHADGRVSGQFEEFSEQEGGQRIHASVVCFTVVGNTARLAARLEKSNVDFGPLGSYVIWSVIDNGEGTSTSADQTTDIFFGGTRAQAEFHCNVGFNLAPFFSSMRGNLQVEG